MRKIFVVIWLGLLGFQVWSTNIKQAYSLTPAEVDAAITRMNVYPRQAAKMGYLLEVKKEGQIVNRMIGNFFTAIDLNEYFGRRPPVLLFVPTMIGFYFVVWEKRWRMMLVMFVISIGVMTVIGSHGKYGPALILGFIWWLIGLGLGKTLKVI